jgi:hypothetical protein
MEKVKEEDEESDEDSVSQVTGKKSTRKSTKKMIAEQAMMHINIKKDSDKDMITQSQLPKGIHVE